MPDPRRPTRGPRALGPAANRTLVPVHLPPAPRWQPAALWDPFCGTANPPRRFPGRHRWYSSVYFWRMQPGSQSVRLNGRHQCPGPCKYLPLASSKPYLRNLDFSPVRVGLGANFHFDLFMLKGRPDLGSAVPDEPTCLGRGREGFVSPMSLHAASGSPMNGRIEVRFQRSASPPALLLGETTRWANNGESLGPPTPPCDWDTNVSTGVGADTSRAHCSRKLQTLETLETRESTTQQPGRATRARSPGKLKPDCFSRMMG